jgi:L-lactate dehydrogenase complex protein LldG
MSRDGILGRIRAARTASPPTERPTAHATSERIARPPRHPRPAFADLIGADREARLIRCLEDQGATVVSISSFSALPDAVVGLLASPPPAPRLVLAGDPRLGALHWPAGVAPEVWTAGQTLGDGFAALTHAEAAVAETGTIVLASSAASPASLAFLPEVHLVAVRRDTIFGAFEEAFAAIAGAAPGRLPRAINLVSGPSRTGDIGGRIVRGAHGPRRLGVILYDGT